MNDYPKAWWIELIGFDNRESDLGVAALFDRAGFTPDAVVLLLWSNDFIHSHHDGAADRDFLRQDVSGYFGRLTGAWHDRQHWRVGELRRLVAEMRKRGVEVYFSVFDQLMNPEAARRFRLEDLPPAWSEGHPELCFVARDGERVPAICPWKRLKSGEFYEDFFLEQLGRVMRFYDFDGFHGADGYIHQRLPLNLGDFSDDMVAQSGILCLETDPVRRAAEIWRDHRGEWIDFYCRRHREFWRKCAALLRADRRKLIVNSIWTRDPFEARYRYGSDYRTMAEIGVDAVILEAPSTVMELENWARPEGRPLYGFMASLLRIKAVLPQTPVWYMNGVRDTLEEYNAIGHAPASLEAEVEAYRQCLIRREEGWRFALDGILSCLSDALTAGEWQWLKAVWDQAFATAPPENWYGVTVLWSDAALDRELDAYCRGRFVSSFRLHTLLLQAGAPVNAIADMALLEQLSGPVVVLNPRFLDAGERDRLAAYRGGPVIRCEAPAAAQAETADPDSWLELLPEPDLPEELLRSWMQEMAAAVRLPRPAAAASAHLFSHGRRLTLINDLPHYQTVRVELPRKPGALRPRRNIVLPPDPERLEIKLPPYGMAALEIEEERNDA